jgi:peptidoglycan/LPS O-acetylase OafA/YrhL
MKAQHRLTGLDGLRAIAALGVLLHHFSEHASRLAPELFFSHPVKGITGVLWPFQVGSQGVTLFFIISGFVILNSLMRCERGIDFAFGRFSRLYPLFWFAVCVTTLVRVGLSHDDVSLRNFLANLTMVPTLWSESIIDGVYWTLIVELKFYLLAYLVWRFKGLAHMETLCAGWLSLTVVNQLLLQRGLAPELTHWATDWLILKHAPLFTCGIMLFSLHQRGSAPVRWALLLVALALAAGGGGPIKGVVALASCLAVWAVCQNIALPAITSRPMVYLGGASYAIYLLHSTIGWHIGSALFNQGWSVTAAVLTAAMVCMSTALLAHHLIEKPSQAWLRQWWAARRHSSARG